MRDRRTGPMSLLAQGIPLTLLMDLLAPPDARELYASEGMPADRPASGPGWSATR